LGERLSFWQLTGGTVLVLGLTLNVFGPRLSALWRKPWVAPSLD
jgi:O-acetylserine/cysteine efflux transporter